MMKTLLPTALVLLVTCLSGPAAAADEVGEFGIRLVPLDGSAPIEGAIAIERLIPTIFPQVLEIIACDECDYTFAGIGLHIRGILIMLAFDSPEDQRETFIGVGGPEGFSGIYFCRESVCTGFFTMRRSDGPPE